MPTQPPNMAAGDAKYGPGGHYSGRNPVPTIQKFMANLDSDKKERDRQIAEQKKAEKDLQDLLDKFTKKVDEVTAVKEKELMAI